MYTFLSTARWRRWVLFLLALMVVPVFSAYGQGKIAGQVTNAESGDPLPGVNVIIESTQQGTATSIDGNYVILNVRPGTYTLLFSFIGFGTKRIEDIRVETGRTTRIDATLGAAVIEGQEIVVQAERPLVRKDLTASRQTVTAREIEALPVESFLGVLRTQAGVTQGPGGAIHIRGGRSNEISYRVDGLSVGNPFETNGLATTVPIDAIAEMTVISGAFNAEYGKAMSGIVNIVTKDGGDRFEGSITAYGGDTFTSHDEMFNTPGGVNLNNYTLEGALSGPLFLDGLTFLASGRRVVDQGHIFGISQHLPSDAANFNESPYYYELQGAPWHEFINDSLTQEQGRLVFNPLPDSLTKRVSMNPSSSYNALGKITYRPFPGARFNYSFLTDGSERTPFSFAYLYNPEGVADVKSWSTNHSIHWTHTLGERTFYEVDASYARNSYRLFLFEDPTDERYVPDLSGNGRVLGFPGNNFLFGGDQKSHIYEDSRSVRGSFDVTRQFGATHEVQTGIDLQFHRLNRENFVVLYDEDRYLTPTVDSLSTSVHDKYGCRDYISRYLSDELKQEYDRYLAECEPQRVFELSAYAQDKIEFENFVINAGLRFEHFEPNGRYIPNLLEPQGDLAKAEPTNLLLPRLGVSFPITSRGIIHFSYGHFTQMPRLRNMYINPEFEFPVGQVPTFGNANLRPEQTVQYEVGLQQQMGDLLAFTITGYYKDIRDYLAPQLVRYSTIAGQSQYVIYRNKDYANVKGFTFSLTRRRPSSGLLSANVNYTFQLAEGNNDDGNAFFFNFLSGRENEFEVVPLDFDQRHVLSTTITLSQPGNWGASLIGQYETGYPYTPLLFKQNIDQIPNSGRKPNQIDLDARVFKNFDVGVAQLRIFAKAFNLLDRLNQRFVFDDTGSAEYSLAEQRNVHAAWESSYNLPGMHNLDEWTTRPHYFSAPRSVRLGLTITY